MSQAAPGAGLARLEEIEERAHARLMRARGVLGAAEV
jgi:hypothetical protein